MGKQVEAVPCSIKMTWPMYRYGECRFEGKLVKLTRRETDLLTILLMNRGKTLSRLEILERMYSDEDEEPIVKIIDTLLCRLRRKLPGVIGSLQEGGYGTCRTGGLYIPREESFKPLRTTEESFTADERLLKALQSN